jgi:pimeloyl-ACP methyl ester carboxylesterase
VIKAAGELSLRIDAVGGDVASRVVERPPGWIDGVPHVILLVHGFNNNQGEACDAFGSFLALLPDRLGPVGRFFWPGDADFGFFQWLDFLSYPTEIPDARHSAERLADYLVRKAQLSPNTLITLVGHSLGCRLVLEMLDCLTTRPVVDRPMIHLIVLMAAAVPVDLAEEGRRLRIAREIAGECVVLYSPQDLVLHLAFPAGQTLAFAMGNEGAVYLEAVGRFGNPSDFATDPPILRAGNRHGSYWKDREAAAIVARKLAAPFASRLAEHWPPDHTTPPSRNVLSRSTPVHTVRGGAWSVCAAGDGAGPSPTDDDLDLAP